MSRYRSQYRMQKHGSECIPNIDLNCSTNINYRMSNQIPSSSSQAAPTPDIIEEQDPNGNDESQGTEVLHEKKRLKSVVWEDFIKKKIGGQWKAECIWCHNKLGADSKNGTRHLLDHIKICKSREARKGLRQSTLTMTTNLDRRDNLERYVFDQEVTRKDLARMICLHEYPLSIVEHVGFKKFCASMQPLFKVVSRNTIRKDIISLFEVNKVAIMNYFQKVKSRIAITTDMWTASHQKKSYMAVTSHFIDSDWKLKSFLLRFIYVPAPHTSEVICDILHEVFVDWNIDRRVSTITLDNCSTNDNLIEKMLDKLSTESLLLDGKLLHMRCCAHILNLIVKDGMSIMEKNIEKIRDSVSDWSATPKRHEKFEKTASQMSIAYQKRLTLDCKTRWNSTYIMLNTALLYEDVFAKLASRDKLFAPFCPSKDDWSFAKELCDRLKLFYDATEFFSGSNYTTTNLFFPKICGIYLAMRKWAASGVLIVETMSNLMITKFEKYRKEVHSLMAIATVLDPRYKLHLLRALFISIYGAEHAENEVNEVRETLYRLVMQYQDNSECVATSDGATSISVHHGGADEVFDIFDQYMSSQPVSSCQLRTELDLYLEKAPLPRT